MMWMLLLLVLVLAGVWCMWVYNRLVRARNLVRNGWADIDVQLQRRHDLVPQLVEVVRTYAAHENALMQSVTQLRAQALQEQQPAALAGLESQLEHGLGRLLALREAYPDLKADSNFRQLHDGLVQVEQHLQSARRFYNGAVRDYNTALQTVPDVIVARALNFTEAAFFSAETDARQAVQVQLS